MNSQSRARTARVVAGAIVLAALFAAPAAATTPCDQNQGVVIDAMANPPTIGENNHKYVSVTILKVVGDDDTPPVTVELVSATSSEADTGLGRGDKPNDIVQVDEYTFLVRAELGKDSSGRTYSFVYRATDGCGATDEATATVTVIPR
jgi:hypothetical protein